MATVIKRGEPYRYYDFICPKCHSVVRFGEYELHEYEDCYDTPMVETDTRCPNCGGPYINVPKFQLKNYLVVNHNKSLVVNDDKSGESKKVGFIQKILKALSR